MDKRLVARNEPPPLRNLRYLYIRDAHFRLSKIMPDWSYSRALINRKLRTRGEHEDESILLCCAVTPSFIPRNISPARYHPSPREISGRMYLGGCDTDSPWHSNGVCGGRAASATSSIGPAHDLEFSGPQCVLQTPLESPGSSSWMTDRWNSSQFRIARLQETTLCGLAHGGASQLLIRTTVVRRTSLDSF
jgi:hypothetical protein